MHELSIVDALIGQVRSEIERTGQSGRVTRLEVVVGRLSGVHPESFRFAYQLLAPGTLVEGAELVIHHANAVCVCSDCRTETELEEFVAVCPACGSSDIAFQAGRDLVLQTIELEDKTGDSP